MAKCIFGVTSLQLFDAFLQMKIYGFKSCWF